MLTIHEKIEHCDKKSREQRYFIAPRTLLREIEQEKIDYRIEKDTIYIMKKQFRIERG